MEVLSTHNKIVMLLSARRAPINKCALPLYSEADGSVKVYILRGLKFRADHKMKMIESRVRANPSLSPPLPNDFIELFSIYCYY